VFRPVIALACFISVLGISAPSTAATTPEQIAALRTGSLLKQLEHIATAREMGPCEALMRFSRVKPFDGALDPWGYKIVYGCENGRIRVQSVGADGALGTSDDIISGSSDVPLGLRPLRAARKPPVAKPAAPNETDASAERLKRRGAGALFLFVAGLVAWVVVSESRS
jgi:hypothetical protein